MATNRHKDNRSQNKLIITGSLTAAFFYSQLFVENFVYTLLENNHYICLISNQ